MGPIGILGLAESGTGGRTGTLSFQRIADEETSRNYQQHQEVAVSHNSHSPYLHGLAIHSYARNCALLVTGVPYTVGTDSG